MDCGTDSALYAINLAQPHSVDMLHTNADWPSPPEQLF